MSFWTFCSFACVNRTAVFVNSRQNKSVAVIFTNRRWFLNTNRRAWASTIVFSSFFEFNPDFARPARLHSRARFWNDFESARATVAIGLFSHKLDWFDCGAHWVVDWSVNSWAFETSRWRSTWLAFEAIVIAAFTARSVSDQKLGLFTSWSFRITSVGSFNVTFEQTGRIVSDF